MCRSIKTLRPPFTDAVTEADIHAAALQYVRKVSGFRTPAAHNAAAFEAAVAEVAQASARLLAALEVRGGQGVARGAGDTTTVQRRSSPRPRDAAAARRGSAVSNGASSRAASAR